jgi:geranylgeranyl pyrophosphate synthase
MKLIKSDSKKKFDQVYEFVIKYDGIGYSTEKAEMHSALAKNAISALKNSDSKRSLIEFADYVIERDS